MAGFTAVTTFGSVIYSWLYINTKSLLLLILFHTLQNVAPLLIMGGVLDPLGGFSTALFTLIVIFVIIKKYGEKTLKGIEEEAIEKKQI
jgi:membrane protease YdiL (CAAX protease family)